jgi:GNAT superfamily N-acetyltransferase
LFRDAGALQYGVRMTDTATTPPITIVPVWAVTCFVTRAGFRRRGISGALARATVDFARERGARALEGYPMITQPGQEITWGELHVGSRSIFAAAGFAEVSRPTLRRVVMRIDF